MKRIIVVACTVACLLLGANTSHASWGHLSYSGYQPWWNIFAKRYKCLTPEEERLQKFWHDYYDALQCFYKSLDAIDWVAYYKNHGYQINGCGPYGGGGSCGRVNYAPVFVSPVMQWAIPSGATGGPPVGPGYGGYPGMGGPPMNGGYGYPMSMGPGGMGMGGPMGYPGAYAGGPMMGGMGMGPMLGMPTQVPEGTPSTPTEKEKETPEEKK